MEDIDLEAGRGPKRSKLIHHASRRVPGRAAADQELILNLSNELSSAMRQLQDSNIALDIYQQSKKDIMKMQASLNEINRLLITRYQEHEDMEADLDDEENSRDRRRYTDQIFLYYT